MIFKIYSLFTLLSFFGNTDNKTYIKHYHSNGKLKEEGWVINDKKTDYWFYYYENGLKKEEGHYKNNQRTAWWIHYDKKQSITKKCEYKDDKIHGLVIVYSKGDISKAEKYNNGLKLKTWTDIKEFRKDNNHLFY